MLTERKPVPHRIGVDPLPVGVLAEISQQVQFEPFDARPPGGEPQQAARQVLRRPRLAAERERRAEATERLVPRLAIERVDERAPRRRANDSRRFQCARLRANAINPTPIAATPTVAAIVPRSIAIPLRGGT